MATNLIRIKNEAQIKERLEAERARLRKIAGLDQSSHFHRPVERPLPPKSAIASPSCSAASPGSTKT